MGIQQNLAPKLASWLERPKPFQLKMLNKVFDLMIPFSAPHKIRIIAIEGHKVSMSIPYKRKNLNHLGGIHACGLATLGEFSAGISIIRRFPFSQYRLILKDLQCEFTYQGKTDLLGEAEFEQEQIDQVLKQLETEEKVDVPMVTKITDKNQNAVAVIKTTWQIKDWSRVKTKA